MACTATLRDLGAFVDQVDADICRAYVAGLHSCCIQLHPVDP